MQNYVNRIIPILKFNPTKTINDNPQIISNYIAQTSQFINNLMTQQNAVPPFQVDLVFAINELSENSKPLKPDLDDTDDDDDSDHDTDHDDNDNGMIYIYIRRNIKNINFCIH